jgi:glycosyltransferase involved in cell wall biosynthesis
MREGKTKEALKASVVIPAFNAEATIAETLESVFAQRFDGSVEVIVVNDGSTDGTRAVLEKYGDRIRVIDQPNRGISAARNAAIAAAAGEYIALLDADDSWTEDKLEKTVPVLDQKPECVAVFSDGITVDSTGVGVLAPFYVGRGYDHSPTLDEMLDNGRPWPILLGTFVVRRETILAVGGFAEEFGREYGAEDAVVYLRIRELGEILYVPQKLMRYRMPLFQQKLAKSLRPHNGNAKSRGAPDPDQYFRGNSVWARLMLERYGERGRKLANYAIDITAREQAMLGMMAMDKGDREFARRCYRASIRHRPLWLKTYFRLGWAMLPTGISRQLSPMLSPGLRRSLSGPPFLEERTQ